MNLIKRWLNTISKEKNQKMFRDLIAQRAEENKLGIALGALVCHKTRPSIPMVAVRIVNRSGRVTDYKSIRCAYQCRADYLLNDVQYDWFSIYELQPYDGVKVPIMPKGGSGTAPPIQKTLIPNGTVDFSGEQV